MQSEEINKIIEQAKAGNQEAKNTLIKLIQNNGYIKMVNRYLYMNRLLEPEDVKSEFWLGIVLALPRVNTTIGDPVYYLAWQGVNRVKSQLRKQIGKGVQVQCNECGWIGRLYRKGNGYECRECGSKSLDTHQKEINLTSLITKPARMNEEEDQEQFIDQQLHISPPQLEIDTDLDIEHLKSKLSPQELRVFILITEQGIDRDHEANYLQTIADTLKVSPQCINQYLKKIRKKILKWKEEGTQV